MNAATADFAGALALAIRAAAGLANAMPSPTYTAGPESLTANMDAFVSLMANASPTVAMDASGLPIVPPLNVDRGLYEMLDALGDLLFMGLRDASGSLVGASLALVKPHPHFQTTITATVDVFLVTPKTEAAGGAMVLFNAMKAELKARGADRWLIGERLDVSHALPLMELGRPVQTYWSLSLEAAT